MSYYLTIQVDHCDLDPVTIQMHKVDEGHISISVSPDCVDEVKPIKGIQQELYRNLESFYKKGLQSLSFTISQVGKKKTQLIAAWDPETKLSNSKLSKAIKESITKLKSSQVESKKKKSNKPSASHFVHPKRRKAVHHDNNNNNETAVDDDDNTVVVDHQQQHDNDMDVDGGETIVDGQGAIKKVKNNNKGKQAVAPKQKAKADVQAVPKVNKNGKVQKKVAVKAANAAKTANAAAAPVHNSKRVNGRAHGGGARGSQRGVQGGAQGVQQPIPNGATTAVPVDATAAPVMGNNNGGAIAPPQVVG